MRFFTRSILAMLMLFGLAPRLAAQLDSRLATNTDLLDVYKTAPAKPELLTIYDFSGSMHAMYWHPSFWTNYNQSSHSSPWGSDDFPGAGLVLDTKANVYMKKSTGYYRDVYSATPLAGFASGTLVKPDGTIISPLSSGAYTVPQLVALVRTASHVRMACTSGSVTRTIDLPIPWVMMKRTSSSSADLIHLTVTDPSNSVAVEPDQLYTVAPGGGAVNDNIVNQDQSGRGYKIGRFHYNYDYLYWLYFGTDARNADGNGATDTGKYIIPAVAAVGSSKEPVAASTANGVWANGIPAMTRFQALKYGTVDAWYINQDKVWWGYRCLDGSEEKKSTLNTSNGNAYSTAVSRDIRLFKKAVGTTVDPQLLDFIKEEPQTATPLTYAVANAYAQLVVTPDSGSTFGPLGAANGAGTEATIPTCRKTFVVVFTDGIANDGYTANGDGSALGKGDVYIDTSTGIGGELGATYGNRVLDGKIAQLAPGYGSTGLFNIWTLAGVAAHYDKSVSGVLSNLAPFKITMRGATATNPRRIRTMTVGVSLAGQAKDADSGKADLFRAALYGNPDDKAWDLAALPFDPTNPNANDSVNNPFFFDATDPTKLAAAMTTIINEVTAASASISAPSSPLVGLNLGKQAYLGLFQTNRTGPVWQGDLLMAGVKITSSGINFIANDGTVATDITSDNAMWSASASLLSKRSWMPAKSNGRKIYTMPTATSTSLIQVTDTTASITNAMMGASSDPERQQILRFLLGAGPTAVLDPTKDVPRTSMLGDIINSSPAALTYPLSKASSSAVLSAWLAANPTAVDPHFRVIFVADNQGYFHAFGEVSGLVSGVPQGAVDELWAFVPYQNLPGFKYLMNQSNPHIYMFDGSPMVYFLDQATSGGSSGNGIVDSGDSVRIVVGMGKGGRSYFAFDVADPLTPTLAWVLNPDTSANTVVQHMGLATTRPAVGRVETTSSGTKDLVFIGGGLSTYEIDNAFSAAAPAGFGPGARMGRNIVALDVLNGSIYQTWDFTTGVGSLVEPKFGSIAAGVVPFEFLSGSRRTQRLYFTDQPTALATGTPRGSGVWALGDAQLTPLGIRLDSSVIDNWTTTGTNAGSMGLRRVYQAKDGTIASTLPTPFNLGSAFPVPRNGAPTISPAAVGVAVGFGDRWDPMDKDTANPVEATPGAGQNRFVMVFDRQDSAILASNSPAVASADTNGLTDSVLADLSAVNSNLDPLIQVGGASYYLNSKYGYLLNLPVGTTSPKGASNPAKGGSNYYYTKIITSPVVLEGVGFFSTFLGTDTAGSCGGSGQSKTYRLCDILRPVFNNGTTLADANSFDPSSNACSGVVSTFVNIPGDITTLGTAAVIQSGQGKTSDGSAGSIGNAGAQVAGVFGKKGNLAFRARSWRIVR